MLPRFESFWVKFDFVGFRSLFFWQTKEMCNSIDRLPGDATFPEQNINVAFSDIAWCPTDRSVFVSFRTQRGNQNNRVSFYLSTHLSLFCGQA